MVKKKKEIKTNAEASSSGRKKGKEYHEIFEVEKKGKKKILDVKGFEDEEEEPSKKQIKEENKILRNIFIIIGILAILALVIYFVINNARNFEYENIEFEIVKFCDAKPCLILYQTKFPVFSGEKIAEYNFYLRNDPRKLNVPFIGNLNLRDELSEGLAINISDELNCNGDAVIALGNIVNFYGLLDVEFVRNEALGCNQNGKSIFLNIQQGNETSIEQTGPLCYKISINNCEILEGTERFLLESFVELNKLIKKEI